MIRVLSIGCYDLLHYGHMVHLRTAKQLGDFLVVAITEDDMVTKEKGPGHPLFPAIERYSMLSGMRCVDQIIIHRDFYSTVRSCKPNIVVKGADWKGKMDKEQKFLDELGVQLVFLDERPIYSSTEIMTGKLFHRRAIK